MNNKLDEYRDREAASYDNCASSMAESMWMPMGYAAGFNAAIALDLPVKFALWERVDDVNRRAFIEKFNEENDRHPDLGELYKYWLDNIYKPE